MPKLQQDPTAQRLAILLEGKPAVATDSADTPLSRAEIAEVERVRTALTTARDRLDISPDSAIDALAATGRQIGEILRRLNRSGVYVTAKREVISLDDPRPFDGAPMDQEMPRLTLLIFRPTSDVAAKQ